MLDALPPDFFSNCFRLIVATLLAVPIAWDRERRGKIMGLRTYPLIAISSCGFILLGNSILSSSQDDAQARLLQGLMTGIGFLGAGALTRRDDDDRGEGTATAASVWTTGVIGASVALERYEIALALSALNFAVLRLGTVFKSRLEDLRSDD